jgi:hypothetical protein
MTAQTTFLLLTLATIVFTAVTFINKRVRKLQPQKVVELDRFEEKTYHS